MPLYTHRAHAALKDALLQQGKRFIDYMGHGPGGQTLRRAVGMSEDRYQQMVRGEKPKPQARK